MPKYYMGWMVGFGSPAFGITWEPGSGLSLFPFISYGTFFARSLASCVLGMIPCTILALFCY